MAFPESPPRLAQARASLKPNPDIDRRSGWRKFKRFFKEENKQIRFHSSTFAQLFLSTLRPENPIKLMENYLFIHLSSTFPCASPRCFFFANSKVVFCKTLVEKCAPQRIIVLGSSATFSNSGLCLRVLSFRGTPGHHRVAQELEHASKRLAFRLTQARCEVAVKTSKALSNSVSVQTRLHLRLAGCRRQRQRGTLASISRRESGYFALCIERVSKKSTAIEGIDNVEWGAVAL